MSEHVPQKRPRCQYLLRYMGRSYCREVWRKALLSPAKELPFGCPAECPDYHAAFPTDWSDDIPDTGVERRKQGG